MKSALIFNDRTIMVPFDFVFKGGSLRTGYPSEQGYCSGKSSTQKRVKDKRRTEQQSSERRS